MTSTDEPRSIVLMRHCKSDWDREGSDDFDRPLSRRGRKDARRMARLLRDARLDIDAVIASPSARTRETVTILTERLRTCDPVVWEPSFYGTEADAYLAVLRALDDGLSAPLLVGHNPALEHLAAILTGGTVRLPTGAALLLRLGTELRSLRNWAELDAGRCTVAWLVTPRLARELS